MTALETIRSFPVAPIRPELILTTDEPVYVIMAPDSAHQFKGQTTLGQLPIGTKVAVDVFKDGASPAICRVIPWNDSENFDPESAEFHPLSPVTAQHNDKLDLLQAVNA